MQKRLICIIMGVLMMALSFCGCSVESNIQENIPYKTNASQVESGIVAKDGDLSLEWNAERCSLAILKGDKVIWASMPLSQYNNKGEIGKVEKYLESHLIVNYKSVETNNLASAVSYMSAFENGRIYSYKVENGIRLLYCFDEECFAIPVIYRLIDGSLDVMLENKNIYESGNQVYSISVLPYSSSVGNLEENRIFIPDGSGMVMKCDTNRTKREYSGSVYGDDPAEPSKYKFLYNQNINLPVFAVSSKETNTYCTIIKNGEVGTSINAMAGDTTMGCSYAYATFNIRGAETAQIAQGWGTVSISALYSDISRKGSMGLKISFLDSVEEDFSNVAEYYRNYLIKEKGLKQIANDRLLYLDIPMALSQKEFIFGIPNNKTVPITTYEQVKNITNDIYENTGISPIVRLSGIQSGGLEVSKIAGGYKTEKVLGNKKALNDLIESSKKLNIELYPDFDITRYNKSSAGFSLKSDSVKSPTKKIATQYFYSISTGTVEEKEYTYNLLSPKKLFVAAEKLVGKLNEIGFDKVSLSSLGYQAYSDYGYEEGYIGADYLYNIKKINEMLAKNKVDIMYENANQYAAVSASHITDVPLYSSGYNVQDEWLPFYQMVFKGYVPMSSESVNLVDDSRTEILRAIQLGIGLKYTVCGSETSNYATSKFSQLLAGNYENSKENIHKTVNEVSNVLKKVQNATIVNFEYVSDNVYTTNFSNGIKITVNYNDFKYENIEAQDYTITDGGLD